MTSELSLIELIVDASLLVQLVMLMLLAASVMSWFIILQKNKVLKQAAQQAERFEDSFWSGGDLKELYTNLTRRRLDREGMEKIFESGFAEFIRGYQSALDTGFMMSSIQRSMKVVLSREEDRLESNLTMLATIGSTSPYIGLFGTVWGIMNSFTSLGTVQNATLNMVAPGIAEALIATAMGLFAAIPAYIAYNRFADQVDRMLGRYENFMQEFTTILQRQSHKPVQAAVPQATAEQALTQPNTPSAVEGS